MDRREFLKLALTAAALSPLARLSADDSEPAPDISLPGKVTRRKFKDDLTLPLIGFGTMRFPMTKNGPDQPAIQQLVDLAMESGCNYFDTAYVYKNGNCEIGLREALKKYPRESYMIADKMPGWKVKNADDMERVFNESLNRCGVKYFDFYLMHSMSAASWAHAKKIGMYEFLAKKKAEGKIRNLGFSFHDKPDLLKEILATYTFDFAQIQLNVLDWKMQRADELYDILEFRHIPVIVMEPLRGGALGKLNPKAVEILKKEYPKATPASFALRWIAELPNVVCILSGLGEMAHAQENFKTFTPFVPLKNMEKITLLKAVNLYCQDLILCTGCEYCMPCPAEIDIPRNFAAYNQMKIYNKYAFRWAYNEIPKDSRAENCVSCKKCISKCPQHLDIPRLLTMVTSEVKKIK